MIHYKIILAGIANNSATLQELCKFIEFAGERLNIKQDIYLTIFNNESLLNKFSINDCEYQALLYQTEVPFHYNLIVRNRPSASLKDILAHEMSHLHQYVIGDLKVNLKTGVCQYKGNTYDNSIPYNKRPWEQEAFKMQNKLLKEFRKSMRSCKLKIK